jgi:DNA polymerase I-like protein with 3'-5' exonuclease and polymerase domains
MKSFDMFGRRRTFRQPTDEDARNKIVKYWKESIALPEHVAESNIQMWMENNPVEVTNKKTGAVSLKLKRPTGDVKFWLTHREPNEKEIAKAKRSITSGIERQGKNLPMQATNVSIIKLAMGSGYSPAEEPYLFHALALTGAKAVGMVHDELKIIAPEGSEKKVAKEAEACIKRAAAEVFTSVVMEAEYHTADHWEK